MLDENNQLFRLYDLEYAFDGLYSVLNEVKLTGANGNDGSEILNTNIFKYGDYEDEISYEHNALTDLNGGHYDFFTGDFNNDGLSDFLVCEYFTTSENAKIHTNFRILLRNQNGGYNLGANGNFPQNFRLFNEDQIPDRYNYMLSDFDGDANTDFLAVVIDNFMVDNGVVVHSFVDEFKVVRILDNGYSVDFSYSFEPYVGGSPHYPIFDLLVNDNQIIFGDFDGDSRMDVITILYNSHYEYASKINFIGKQEYNNHFWFEDESNFNLDWLMSSDDVTAIDFTGDGKQELFVKRGGIFYLFKIEKDTEWSYKAHVINNEINGLNNFRFLTANQPFFFGDFNGDRKTDILFKTASDDWSIAYSKGNSFDLRSVNIGSSVTFNEDGIQSQLFELGDLNNDGKTDIITSTHWSEQQQKIFIMYSDGYNFKTEEYDYNGQIDFNAGEGEGKSAFLTNLNGDNMLEITLHNHVFQPWLYSIYIEKNSQKRLLQKVANGFNEILEIDYAPLTKGGRFYSKGRNNFEFPVTVIQPAMYAVEETRNSNGVGSLNKTKYSYKELKIHRLGKGMLGFSRNTSNDLTFNTITDTYFDLNTTFYHNRIKMQSKNLNDGSQISLSSFFHKYINLGNNRFYTQLVKTQEQDFVNFKFKVTDNEYDNFGNATKITENNNLEESVTTISYDDFGAPFPVYPTNVSTSKTREGSTYQSSTKYNYNNRGNLIEEIKNVDLPCETKTLYEYNNFGNLTSKTVSAENVPTLNSSVDYDDKGRMPIRKINTIGQSEFFENDYNLGEILEYTDITGLITRYKYDVFGKLVRENHPDNTSTIHKFSWDIQNGQFPSIYKVETTSTGLPKQTVWYDLFGRETRKEKIGFNDETIFKYWQYSSKGNLIRESKPYKMNETPLVNSFQYDEYNRVFKISNNLGTTTYEFSGEWALNGVGLFTTKVTSPSGKVTTQTEDVSGTIIKSTDDGGTIFFSYDPLGNLIKSETDDNVLSTSEYNECGWQIALNDNSAGTTSYEYDAYANLTKQTNALNQTTAFEYDDLGRKTQKILPEGTINYDYWPNNNLIKQIVDYNGNQELFLYDNLNRLRRNIKDIDGEGVQKDVTYNQIGLVDEEIYNTGLTIKNNYDDNGYLKSITANNQNIYRIDEMNAYLQVEKYRKGNGKSSIINYQHSVAKEFYTEGIQDLRMNINMQNGNVNNRFDALKGITESFTYDDNERLLTANTSNSQYSITMNYSDFGNLEYKSDVGDYTYHDHKIFAVKQVSNPNNVVPNQAQNVTYNSFAQPVNIVENNHRLILQYGADGNRNKTTLKDISNNQDIYTRYYFGDVEMQVLHHDNDLKQTIHYISGLHGLAAMAVKEDNGNFDFYYTYTDHLGSILTVTDDQANIVADQNFDAWGRRRNVNDWSFTPPLGEQEGASWLYRGYTGHEHLPEFNLINMNGRLYDPLLARFLSPDNYIQSPFNTQSHNRFSYVWNNPLKYNDPDGQWVHIAVGALIGGTINLIVKRKDIKSIGEGFAAFGVGAAAGAIGAATGGAAFAMAGGAAAGAGGFAAGAASGAIGAGYGTIALSAGNTAVFNDPVISTKDFLMSVGIGTLTGGLMNGIIASVNGKNFWTGGSKVGKNVAGLSSAPSSSKNQAVNSKNQKGSDIVSGKKVKGKYTAEVMGDFEKAQSEWNNIRKSYGLQKSSNFPDGFEVVLKDGSEVSGVFYQGGNTNPNGYNVKITTTINKNLLKELNKIPPVYLRYKN